MTVHPTRVDAWLWFALLVPIAMPIVSAVALHDRGSATTVAVLALAGYAAVLAGLVFPMRYTISGDGIEIRAGVTHRQIAWPDVDAIELSNNPRSSPALSLQRLEITYRKAGGETATVCISPVERERFLADCAATSRSHVVAAGALRRRT